jgi:adenylate cyclase class 2
MLGASRLGKIVHLGGNESSRLGAGQSGAIRDHRAAQVYFRVPSVATKHEIEVKLRIADLTLTMARIKALGAKSIGRVLEQNTLFDTPESDFRRTGRLLRVRVETPAPKHGLIAGPSRAVLTSKAPPIRATKANRANGRLKHKLEREIVTHNQLAWPEVFRNLAFLSGFRYEKYRSSFRLPKLHLDLDETPVGAFLELEGDPSEIHRIALALGFSTGDYISRTYWDLYVAECRRYGRRPHNMLFNA